MTTSINHDIMYKHFFKRIFDFVLALLALVCLSPLLLVVAVWLHFANKGAGVFFLQQRPGLHGKLFKIIKFKTMTDERAPDGTLLPDMQRLTRVGRFVRSTSIDELPQLVNVLKGDMALIGPRPLLPQYLPLYSPEQARRHDVRPLAGPSATAATPSRGPKSSSSMCGMSTTSPSKPIFASF